MANDTPIPSERKSADVAPVVHPGADRPCLPCSAHAAMEALQAASEAISRTLDAYVEEVAEWEMVDADRHDADADLRRKAEVYDRIAEIAAPWRDRPRGAVASSADTDVRRIASLVFPEAD